MVRKLLGRKLWKSMPRVAAAWGKSYCVTALRTGLGRAFKFCFYLGMVIVCPITNEFTTVQVTAMG